MSQVSLAEPHMEAPPSMGVNNDKLGMWIFLASEVMFFSSLIATFLAFKLRGQFEVGNEVLNIPVTALNTFILIVSSFTVVTALEAVRKGNQGRFRLMLLATAVLGVTFLTIQGFEWSALMREGITAGGTLFGTTFFVLTGFHGLHVTIGVLWLLILMMLALQGRYTAEDNVGFEIFGLYWHFVDIVWIVLFTVIYLV